MPTPPASPAAEQLPARTAAVWAALDPVVGAGTPLRVLDVGGGSGMFAVPLARLGHDVTVVDPSADALATLRRRADTAGVGDRVRGVQGDGDLLHEVLPTHRRGAGGYDLALCHYVLEVVDDPAVTLREIAGAAAPRRPGERRDRQPRRRRPRPGRRRPPRGGAGPARGPRPGPRPVPPGPPPLRPGRAARPRRGRPACSRAPGAGVSVVADLLEATSGADPTAVRALELALAEASPYRDVATGLHVLAARP